MSYDLVAFYGPEVHDAASAWHALEDGDLASSATRDRAARFARVAAEAIGDGAFSVSPTVDDAGKIGFALVGSRVEPALLVLAEHARAHGFVVYDAQAGDFLYVDGTSSRAERVVDGVSEGVAGCARDLANATSEAARAEALDALAYFAIADSDDRGAAAGQAIPALVAALDGAPQLVARAVVRAAHTLAEGLAEEDATAQVDGALWARLARLAEQGEDARHVLYALAPVVETGEDD